MGYIQVDVLESGRWPYQRVTALTGFSCKKIIGVLPGQERGRNNKVIHCTEVWLEPCHFDLRLAKR